MSYQKLLQQMIGVPVIMLLLVGCGTPVPPTPKAGHWEGSPYVSFDITSDGNIRDFELVALLEGGSECIIELEEIAVESDGTFTFISELAMLDKEFGNRISGKFDSDTTVTGSYLIEFCGNTIINTIMGDPSKTWSAQWKRP